MPSGKLEAIAVPTIAFGDLGRDEINALLCQAGVSLKPPKKSPFAIGVRRMPIKKAVQHSSPAAAPATPSHTTPTSAKTTPSKLQSTQGAAAPQMNGQAHATGSAADTADTPSSKLTEPHAAASTSPATASTASHDSVSTTASSPPLSPVPVTPHKPKPTSWAALLKSNADKQGKGKPGSQAGSPSAATATGSATASTGSPAANAAMTGTASRKSGMGAAPSVPPAANQVFKGLSDIIQNYEPGYSMPLLEPRGLINNVNTCFMNVILQPLLHCPPFYNLVKTISNHMVHSFKSKTPLLDSLIEFTGEFRVDDTKSGHHNPEPYGEPFVPEYVYDALRGQKRFDSLKGRQEDAEEFLCFLLDGLHEEMISVLNEKKEADEKAAMNKGEASDWLEVGRNNKTSNISTHGFESSPVSKVFGGRMRSTLRCPGAKDSANLEPFQSLPLDIQPDNVKSIEDAIQNLTVPEIMHDFMSPKGVRVEATKQIYFENLPPVLVLHMKRFVFDNVGGVQKLQKSIQYGAELVFQPEWQTPVTRTEKPVVYHLFASVYHHGASAGGGHYTCDVRRQNGEWLHIDDTNIVPVSEQDVLVTDKNTRTSETIHAGQTAYILFYIRQHDKRGES